MHAIIWDPEGNPGDIEPTPDSTDAVILVTRRSPRRASGVVVEVGDDVLSIQPGDLVDIPMLHLPERADSSLRGYAKIPTDRGLLIRLPLAEYNALCTERLSEVGPAA